MKVSEVAKIIEEIAPQDTAMDYDNIGLIVGDNTADVAGVMICVDVTREVLNAAVDSGCNMIIAHHPIIFEGIKRLVKGDYVAEIVMIAVQNNINIYAAHTNMDVSDNGINFRLAEALGGHNIIRCFDDKIGVEFSIKPQLLSSLRDEVATVTSDSNVRLYLPGRNQTVSKCAVIGGSGGRNRNVVDVLVDSNIQVFITAEVANHVRMELLDREIAIIECSHHESESVFCDIIDDLLAQYGLKVLKYKKK